MTFLRTRQYPRNNIVRVTALLIASQFSLAGMARAEPILTATTILARFKTVTGGAAWDSVRTVHTVSALSAGGLTGTDENWADLPSGRFTSNITLGPIKTASGFDGKQAWEKTDTGGAHAIDSIADRQETADSAFISSLAFWYPSRQAAQISELGERSDGAANYDVLNAVPAGGHAIQMWFDRSSGLLTKIVDKGAEQTQTVILSDYRTVPGSAVMEPYTSRQSTGIARYDALETATTVEINKEPPAGEFNLPKSVATDYTFAGGAASVTVPFQYRNAHIFVPIQINGQPFAAIFDTGGQYVIDTGTAAALGLKPQGAMQAGGNGAASVDSGHARVASVQIGSLTLRNPLVLTLPLPSAIKANPIIGAELLQRFIVSIDYDKKTITFTRPDRFQAPQGGTVVPFRFNDDMPEVSGSVDGIPGAFTIDTGAGNSLELYGAFVAKHHLKEKYHPKFTVISGYGVGGPVRSSIVRIGTLKLGGVAARGLVTDLSGGASGAASNTVLAGNVGEGVLHRFNLIFDYGKQTITFTPNRQYGEPDAYTRSGIILSAEANRAVVADVVPGSPAEAAGIEAGDMIVAVDGHTLTGEATDQTFRRKLTTAAAGEHVTLSIDPAGKSKQKTVEIVLRDLI